MRLRCRFWRGRRVAAVAAGLVLVGCEGPRTAPPPDGATSAVTAPHRATAYFEEVAAASGLDFTWQSGHRERHLMPESLGGGVALFDMDGDGDLDVYFVQGGGLLLPPAERPPNRLFRNRGDGTFEDATSGSSADDRGFGMGVACGDYDNDGDVDLLVTNVGNDVLLRNDGGGRFTDVTAQAGILDGGWGTSAAFADTDRDGDLDLLVLRYVHWSASSERECVNALGVPDYCSPREYGTPARPILYRNDAGHFTDVTETAGLGTVFGPGLGVVAADFDDDGWIDFFVANDSHPNQLWMNGHDGTFTDRAPAWGCAVDEEGVPKAGMGVGAEDVDGDGDVDLFVTNLVGESDSFYRREGRGFTEAAHLVGLGSTSRPFTRFGVGWVDFDDDGRLDLYEVSGRVMRAERRFGSDAYAEPDLLFRGVDGHFEEVLPRGGTRAQHAATGRGAAFGDVDGDGRVDVVVVNRDARAYLLRDVAEPRGHWIAVRILDEHGRDALGCRVTTRIAGRLVRRDVRAACSYLSSSDPRVHFGLGEARAVDDVRVTWVDGTVESFGSLPADRVVVLRRGEHRP